MASSRGRAKAAPPLFSSVLRGIAFFVRNIERFLPLLDTRYSSRWWCYADLRPLLKRNAVHNSENDRRKSVSIFPGSSHDLAHSRRIVVFHAAAESEGHQILSQRSDKQLGMRQQGVFESVNSAELRASGNR